MKQLKRITKIIKIKYLLKLLDNYADLYYLLGKEFKQNNKGGG